MTDLTHLTVATAIAGAAAVAVVAVPLYWHQREPREPREPTARVEWLWPEVALQAPAMPPNTIAEIGISLPPLESAHRVKLERYAAETIAPKSQSQPSVVIPEANSLTPVIDDREREARKSRDVCAEEGGYKITTRHGWRCRYPRRRR